jgi:hypothetical protein
LSKNVFDIEVNGQFLDVPDGSFRYELVNSILTTELYQGDWSFPYDIPDTPLNSKILGYANKLDTDNLSTEFSAWLYIFGIPRYSTKLTVTRGKIRSMTITLTGGIKALPNAEKKLSEIDLGSDYFLGNTQALVLAFAKTAAECGDWQTYGFTFVPFYAPDFYGGKNPNFLGVCNRVNPTTGDILGNSLTTVNNKYNLVPFLFLYYVLDRIFKDASLTPSGSFWTNQELSTLLLFNNYAIEIRPEAGNSRLVVSNEHNLTVAGDKVLFDLGPPNTYDNVNGWDSTTNQYTIQSAGDHALVWEIVYEIDTSGGGGLWPPWMHGGYIEIIYDGSVYDTLDLGWSALGDGEKVKWLHMQPGFSSGDIGKAIHLQYKKSTLPGMSSVFTRIRKGTIFKVIYDATNLPSSTPNVLKYKNHVADMTVGELLAQVKKMGVSFNFDTPGEVIMDTCDSVISSSEVIDVSGDCEKDYDTSMEDRGKGVKIRYEFPEEEKAEIEIDPEVLVGEFFSKDEFPAAAVEGTYAIVTVTNEVYMVGKDGSNLNEWQFAGYNYKSYKIGRGENDLTMQLLPMQMILSTNEGGTTAQNTALMPYYPGLGSSSLFGLGINPFNFRLVFWRGYNQNGGATTPKGGKYILANTGLYGINKNQVGDLCFRLDSPNAIARTTSERLFTALNEGRVMEKNMVLDARSLGKIKSTSRLVVDFNVFLIKNLSIELRRTVAFVKAYLLKI